MNYIDLILISSLSCHNSKRHISISSHSTKHLPIGGCGGAGGCGGRTEKTKNDGKSNSDGTKVI